MGGKRSERDSGDVEAAEGCLSDIARNTSGSKLGSCHTIDRPVLWIEDIETRTRSRIGLKVRDQKEPALCELERFSGSGKW